MKIEPLDYTLNIKGRLLSLAEPRVMGILNATPDSFYAQSRVQTEREIAGRANQIVAQGGSIIDVGACSTRPGSQAVSQEEEMERLRMALAIVRREQPSVPVSVDTYRPDVARMVVEECGADIVNDVSGGNSQGAFGGTASTAAERNPPMFRMVARLGVPYVLTSTAPSLHPMLTEMAQKVQLLRDMGQKDIILDPGFGFGKTVEQNYRLMGELEKLHVLQLPLLVGISRKSMIFRLLGTDPAGALNGTTALHAVSLMKGASILRVHDVKEAVECVSIAAALAGNGHTTEP